MEQKLAFLVLDVGKTNKKLLVYDQKLNVAWSSSCEIGVLQRDGLELEDVGTLLKWVSNEVKKVASQYHFLTFAISCHGAAFALVDKTNYLCHPVISYTSKVSDSFNKEFFDVYGNPDDLLRSTGTPDLGFINIGKALHYVKKFKPDAYAVTKTFLFYTQYLGFIFTGKKSLEYTYLGNHSYLWDFQKNEYSDFSKAVGIYEALPKNIQKPWEVLGNLTLEWKNAFGLSYDLPVTIGIHDSNAALLPYLIKGMNNAVLLSTGSWCVGMTPGQPYELSEADVRANTFYNIDCWGRPLRTSIFTGGLEYAAFDNMLGRNNQSDFKMLNDVLNDNDIFVLPGLIKGTGVFRDTLPAIVYKDRVIPEAEMETFINANAHLKDKIYTALNLSLGFQASELLKRLQVKENGKVYVEGGFLKNKFWLEILLNLRPDLQFFSTNLKEASAFGAALTALIASTKLTPEGTSNFFDLEFIKIEKSIVLKLENYQRKYYNLLTTTGVVYAN